MASFNSFRHPGNCLVERLWGDLSLLNPHAVEAFGDLSDSFITSFSNCLKGRRDTL